MQDDGERVAAAIQQAFYEGGGYEGMARAAMAATREIDAEMLRGDPRGFGYPYTPDEALWAADWLQQRAMGAKPFDTV